MNSSYSFTYVHIHYKCGHEALRPVRQAESAARERYSDQRCSHCTDQLERRYAVVREVQQEREEEEVAI